MFQEVVAKLLMAAAKAASPEIRKLLIKLCNNVLVNAEKTDNPWDDILAVMLIEIVKGSSD